MNLRFFKACKHRVGFKSVVCRCVPRGRLFSRTHSNSLRFAKVCACVCVRAGIDFLSSGAHKKKMVLRVVASFVSRELHFATNISSSLLHFSSNISSSLLHFASNFSHRLSRLLTVASFSSIRIIIFRAQICWLCSSGWSGRRILIQLYQREKLRVWIESIIGVIVMPFDSWRPGRLV